MTSVLARALQGRFETAALSDYLDLVIKITQDPKLSGQYSVDELALPLPKSTAEISSEAQQVKQEVKSLAAGYKNKIHEQEEIIRQLQKELLLSREALQKQQEKSQNQLAAGEEEVGKLRAQVREGKVKEQSWVGEREGLKSRIASLEQQATAAQAQRDEAQRQKEEARAQVESSQSERESLVTQIDKLQAKLRDYKSRLAEAQMPQKNEEAEALRSEMVQHRSEKLELELKLRQLRLQLESQSQREKDLRRDLDRLSQGQQNIATERDEAKSKVHELMVEVDMWRDKAREAEETKGRLAEVRDSEIALRKDKAAAELQVTEYKTQLNNYKAQAGRMAQDLQQAQAEVQLWLKKEGDAQWELGQVQDALMGSKANEQKLNDKLQQEEAARQALEKQLKAKEQEIAALQAEKHTRRRSVETQIKDQEEQLASLQAQQAAREATHNEKAAVAASRIQTLEEKLQRMQEDFEASAESMIRLSEEHEELQIMRDRLLRRLEEVEGELEEARNRAARDELQDATSKSLLISPRPIAAAPETIFLIETGSYMIRCGFVDCRGEKFRPQEQMVYTFPCLVARPKNEKADLSAMVQNAGLNAGPMYERFRRDGVFVGKDAWYCGFEHPDPALRSALKLDSPFNRGNITRLEDLALLWAYVLETLQVDTENMPIVVTVKATSTPKEREKMVDILFSRCQAGNVRFLNEAYVLSTQTGNPTSIVVDIGYDLVRVVPVYEHELIENSVKTLPVGGKDCTAYMADMLLSRKDEVYSQQVDRRRLEMARRINERYGMVSKDFQAQVALEGEFSKEKMNVMSFLGGNQSSPAPEMKSKNGNGREVVRKFEGETPDGKMMSLDVGKERFHAPELLFRPSLFADSEHRKGVTDAVIDCINGMDSDLRGEFVQAVAVAGGSSLFPGFIERFTADLKAKLAPALVKSLNVVALERQAHDKVPSSNQDSLPGYTAVWDGAAHLCPQLLTRQFLTDDVYCNVGPSIIEDLKYSGSL